MDEKIKIERYHCNACAQVTKHYVRGEYSLTDHDNADVTSFTQRALIVECCGCEHLAFVMRTHFSEHVDYDEHPVTGELVRSPQWDEAIYPPVTYRAPPPWFEDLPDPTLRQVSEEIYKSLQTESLFLATFGSRTLIDRLIVLTVGDKGNFEKGLTALKADDKISQHEREILNPVLQAGHAAAHRGWAPTREQFKIILDTIEGLIHRLLVLPKLAEELEEAVPSRGGRKAQDAATSAVPVSKKLESSPKALRQIYDELDRRLKSLGDDVAVRPQKHYIAYRRRRNFASVQLYNRLGVIRVYLNLDPDSDSVDLDRRGLRDVRQIGHFGTGDLEVTISSTEDIERIGDLLAASYLDS